jgi:probable HAF family extracellular repeat protein
VVGYSSTANGEEHAISWTAGGGMVDLGTLGGIESRAAVVNSNGQVVGWSTTAGNDATTPMRSHGRRMAEWLVSLSSQMAATVGPQL